MAKKGSAIAAAGVLAVGGGGTAILKAGEHAAPAVHEVTPAAHSIHDPSYEVPEGVTEGGKKFGEHCLRNYDEDKSCTEP